MYRHASSGIVSIERWPQDGHVIVDCRIGILPDALSLMHQGWHAHRPCQGWVEGARYRPARWSRMLRIRQRVLPAGNGTDDELLYHCSPIGHRRYAGLGHRHIVRFPAGNGTAAHPR